MLERGGLNNKILSTCRGIAKANDIVTICIYGSQSGGYARKDSDYDILLVVSDYPSGVRYHYKTVDDKQFAILTVDQKALEFDAEKGDLGGFVAGRLLTPHIPIMNGKYLRTVELTTKRRFAEEDLEDLIIEYGDLSRGLIIEPEYLVLARMEKRSRAYRPLKYSYVNMLRKDLYAVNMEIILDGYRRVLHDLVDSGMIKFDGESITLVNNYVDKVLSYKILNRVVNLMDYSKRAFYSYITHGRAGKVRLNVFAKELASKIKREIRTTLNGQVLEDPKNFLFLKTEQGLVNLNNRDAIIEKIRKIKGNKDVVVQPLAGALNEVHLVIIGGEKLVVKKYTNWYNIKWFVLSIIAYGTKTFHLSGKTRLSNEYVINRLLAAKSIPVPEIISISLEDRMLVERYIQGKPLLEEIIEIIGLNGLSSRQRELSYKIGELIARIHRLDITIGDCKPENFIVGDSKIYVLDLEQGERHGDKAWDVAEFLYYSGHFETELTVGLQQYVKDFIAGYSSIGEKRILKAASGLRYSRVLFPWTSAHIIKRMSELLKST